MNEQDVELLSAFIDDELDTATRETVESRLNNEPELKAKYEELTKLNQSLTDVFSEPEETMPDAFKALLEVEEKPDNVVSLQQSTAKTETIPDKSNNWLLPLAATVAVVSFVTFFTFDVSEKPHSQWQQVADLLETSPSQIQFESDEPSSLAFVATNSFEHTDGRFCREFFTQTTEEQTHGIACKNNQGWQLVESQKQMISDEYITASQTDDPFSLFKKRKMKRPLGTAEEKDLIKNNWEN